MGANSNFGFYDRIDFVLLQSFDDLLVEGRGCELLEVGMGWSLAVPSERLPVKDIVEILVKLMN